MSHPEHEKRTCTRCGRRGFWRAEFCPDCREVEQATSWEQWAQETCPCGHRWAEGNNLRFTQGFRQCRACAREREAAKKAEKRKVVA